MIKSIIKIAIAVLLANGLFRIASAYISYYKFEDAVQEYSIRTGGKSEEQIKTRVGELAAQYEEPVDPDAITVRKDEQRVFIEAKYTKPVAIVPGYEYQWPFSLKADGFVLSPEK